MMNVGDTYQAEVWDAVNHQSKTVTMKVISISNGVVQATEI